MDDIVAHRSIFCPALKPECVTLAKRNFQRCRIVAANEYAGPPQTKVLAILNPMARARPVTNAIFFPSCLRQIIFPAVPS